LLAEEKPLNSVEQTSGLSEIADVKLIIIFKAFRILYESLSVVYTERDEQHILNLCPLKVWNDHFPQKQWLAEKSSFSYDLQTSAPNPNAIP
jgi:hypothetical protein